MKKLIPLISCILLFVCCFTCVSCSAEQNGNQSLFVFLSVRMKGNGDGTITAIAQNEFSIGSCDMPITLTLYASDTQEADVSKMTEVDSLTSDTLKVFQSMRLVEKVEVDRYYCARITYPFRGEPKYIQSDTVRYDKNGNRI